MSKDLLKTVVEDLHKIVSKANDLWNENDDYDYERIVDHYRESLDKLIDSYNS